MANFHPDIHTLIDHSVGSISILQSLLVATHLEICESCFDIHGELLELGGTILRNISFEHINLVLPNHYFNYKKRRKKTKILDYSNPIWNLKRILENKKNGEGNQITDWEMFDKKANLQIIELNTSYKSAKLLLLKAKHTLDLNKIAKNWESGLMVVLTGSVFDHYVDGDYIVLDKYKGQQNKTCTDCICLVLMNLHK